MLFSPQPFRVKVSSLYGERVSRCVTHHALVSLPRRVRETFVAQRRTTMTPPSPCASQRLGDPQVTPDRRSCPVRRFLLPEGWL